VPMKLQHLSDHGIFNCPRITIAVKYQTIRANPFNLWYTVYLTTDYSDDHGLLLQ
jgi:hypothetical protein